MDIYTDGALRRYPTFLVGAWCYYIIGKKKSLIRAQIEDYKGITNNRMEMQAVIEALKATNEQNITLYTDSQYVVLGLKRNCYSKTNVDLWNQMKTVTQGKNIKVVHVMGHQDNVGNNIVDLTMRNMLDPLVKELKNEN